MKRAVLTITFATFVGFSQAGTFPSSFTKCSKSDSNFDECLRNAIEGALKHIAKNGLPEINIPKVDPLVVPKMILDTQGNALKIKQTYRDVKFYGYSDIVVVKAHFDWDTKTLTFTHVIPRLKAASAYTLDGKILLLPVYGHGQSEIIGTNSTTSHTITLKEKTIDSKNYFDIASYKVDWALGGATFQFENLFNGNKELSDGLIKSMNENWHDIYLDVKKALEKKNEEAYKELAQSFFDFVPADDIFID